MLFRSFDSRQYHATLLPSGETVQNAVSIKEYLQAGPTAGGDNASTSRSADGDSHGIHVGTSHGVAAHRVGASVGVHESARAKDANRARADAQVRRNYHLRSAYFRDGAQVLN